MNRPSYQLKLSHFLSTGWGPLYSSQRKEKFYLDYNNQRLLDFNDIFNHQLQIIDDRGEASL